MAELEDDTGGVGRRGRPAGRFQGSPGRSGPDAPELMRCVWCGAQSAIGDTHCTGCGRQIGPTASETPTEPIAPAPDIWSAYSPSTDGAANRRSPQGVPETARFAAVLPPPAGPRVDLAGRGGTAPPPIESTTEHAAVPADPRGRRSRRPELLGLLVVVALVVAVLGLVLAARDSDDGESGVVSNTLDLEDATTVPATSLPPSQTGTVATVPAAPASTIDETTAPATAPPTAAAPSTTEPPSTVASTSTTTAPPSTEPPPTATTSQPNAGDANVLDDPLPSGVRSSEVDGSLQVAQEVSDALAAGDWETVRRLSPALSSSSDAELEDGYGGLDRATQLLVDAEREPGGDRLLLVTIANEGAGARTTLYCVESIVSDDGGFRQTAASVLERYQGTFGIEDVTRDAAITERIRSQCAFQ